MLLKLARMAAVAVVVGAGAVSAQQKFSEIVGPISAKPVQDATPLPVPFITWGGDAATFLANGGLTTANGTIFKDLGLNIQLTPGDDFVGQVKDYMLGKTPFLRGTMRMLGQAQRGFRLQSEHEAGHYSTAILEQR